MARALILVLDSVGIGAAADAAAMATRLRHARPCRGVVRSPSQPFALPNLDRLGLGAAASASTGRVPPGSRRGVRLRRAGAMASRPRAARTRRPAIGRSPASPFPSSGAISPRPSRPFPPTSPPRSSARPGCPASSATATPPARRSSSGSARSMCGPASRSSTPRPIRCCRSPPTRPPSAWTGSMRSAPSPAGSAIPSASAVSSPGPSPAPTPRASCAPPTAATMPCRRPPDHPLGGGSGGRPVVTVGKIGDIFAHVGTGTVLKAAGNAALGERTLEGLATCPMAGC